jgi:hypothetical protein
MKIRGKILSSDLLECARTSGGGGDNPFRCIHTLVH